MDIQATMVEMGRAARAAARIVAASDVEQRNEALLQTRVALADNRERILSANESDLEAGRASGLDPALLDFPALHRGNEALLCWCEGEEMITHWHPVHTGFAGRTPIDDEPDSAWEYCS